MGALGFSRPGSLASLAAAFVEAQQAAASCVTVAVLGGRVRRPTDEPATLAFAGGPARLGRRGDVWLDVRLGHRFAQPVDRPTAWQIVTTNYMYQFQDRDGRLFVAYHWHPVGRSPVVLPHLHVGCRIPPADLSKAHLTTGLVSLPAVIRLAIIELGAEPLRPDWEAVLTQAEREPTA